MSEQEKKRQRIHNFLRAETKQKVLCVLYTKQRGKKYTEKELFKEKSEWRIAQKDGKKKGN